MNDDDDDDVNKPDAIMTITEKWFNAVSNCLFQQWAETVESEDEIGDGFVGVGLG